MGLLCACLLEVTAPLLKLTVPVIEFVTRPEPPGRRDGESFDAEVDSEDCVVLGASGVSVGAIGLFLNAFESDVEPELALERLIG